jgi:hypothetical protein
MAEARMNTASIIVGVIKELWFLFGLFLLCRLALGTVVDAWQARWLKPE